MSQLKNLLNGLLLALLLGLMFSGCYYYDTEEELYGASICDTSGVTFAQTIQPLINSNCVGCHSGAAPSGSVDLSTYAAIKIQADNGKLYGTISQTGNYKPMPPGGKLNSCDIVRVKKWVDGGAAQN